MTSITREELLEKAAEAYDEQGYERTANLHEAIFEIVEPAVAANLKARAKAAIHKDALVSRVFPLVEPLTEIAADDPELVLKQLLYKELRRRVWETTSPLSGKMQALMASRNGKVVCRFGGLTGDSVYVTSDPDCFRVDVIESRSAKDIASVTKLAMFYGGVSRRIPQMADTIAASFEESLQGVLAAGRAHIPALQPGAEDDEDE